MNPSFRTIRFEISEKVISEGADEEDTQEEKLVRYMSQKEELDLFRMSSEFSPEKKKTL